SDVIVMVDGTSFMGLGGPNLVKGAVGQSVDSETLGGARTHNEISGVAHYRAKSDEDCLIKLRELIADLPRPARDLAASPRSPERPLTDIYDIMPCDHRLPYDVRDLLACVLDGNSIDEFQADYAREMITAKARIDGIPVGVIVNQRGLLKGAP